MDDHPPRSIHSYTFVSYGKIARWNLKANNDAANFKTANPGIRVLLVLPLLPTGNRKGKFSVLVPLLVHRSAWLWHHTWVWNTVSACGASRPYFTRASVRCARLWAWGPVSKKKPSLRILVRVVMYRGDIRNNGAEIFTVMDSLHFIYALFRVFCVAGKEIITMQYHC